VRGSLDPNALARVLRGLALSRKEGILHVQKGGVSKRIYLRKGAIIFAGSDEEQDRLGEVLVREGKLKSAELLLALRTMRETGQRLGKTIVEMGFASSEEVAALALERTKSIIRSVFAWSSGTFFFEERATAVGDDMAVELSTAEMILEAARSIEDVDLIREGLGDLKAVLRQPSNPLLPHDGSVSSSLEWLLYQANGVSTIEEIVAASPLDEDKTLRAIFALVLAGLFEIESPDKALAARTESTSTIFGDATTVLASDGPAPPPPVSQIPRTLGRYEVERVLGRGAMGAVYLGRDPTIGRTIAIKLVQTAIQLTPAEIEKYRERFYREARAAGKLLHPGIVAVFDVGHTEDATPFIVMEYVEGRTLQEILATETLEHEEVLRLGAKILEPLAYAHSNGVVHRDIKPSNVLVTPDGAVKIMDFGIAHVIGSEMTQANDVLGSPHYMAPEQLSNGSIDARTDLFAVGVVLYRMLTGKLPFRGDSFASIARAVLFDEPPPPSSLDGQIPAHLNDVVVRCLSKDPASRFETAEELRKELVSPDSDSETRQDRSTSTSRRLRIPRWRLTLAAVLGLSLLLAFALLRGPSFLESIRPERSAAGLDPTPGGVNASAPDRDAKSDVELYHEASVAFERGDLHKSKETLETLMRRNPGFEGGPELLVRVNRDLRNDDPEPASGSGLGPVTPSGEAELLYQATLAFEQDDLKESKRQLEALLKANPSLEGASELLVKVNDEIWKKGLPLSFQAKHNHRIGSCTGTLELAVWGVRFTSDDHLWRWDFEEIRLIERDDPRTLLLETHESDTLSLGKPKNYKFELDKPMRDQDWSRYRRLAR
jgi:serine/threonine protein kinase